MPRLPVIVATTLGLAISGVVTAYLSWTLAAGYGAYLWLLPGFSFSDGVAWFAPPQTDSAKGLYSALGLAVSWIFWGTVAAAIFHLICAVVGRKSAT